MAVNAGQIFVELSLDDKVYKQKLSDQLTSTETTAKGIETSWKVLGAKNDQAYDAMRRSYENALTLIKNSTNSTAQDIIRAEEAKNKKIQELNDRQFGEQKSGLETLKGHYLAVTAAIAVALGTVAKGWEMANAGAAFQEQQQLLDRLGAKYGTTADGIVSEMQRASDGMIPKAELMSIALSGIHKGLRPDQLIELANAATVLGDMVEGGPTVALKNLTEALETGRVKGLKNYLGTALDLEAVFPGLTGSLTETEKAQAMYNLTVKVSAERQKELGDSVRSNADELDVASAKMANNANVLKTWASNVATFFVKGFVNAREAGTGATEAVSDFGMEIGSASRKMEENTASTIKNAAAQGLTNEQIRAQVKAREDAKKAAEEEAKAAKKAAEDQKKAIEELKKLGMESYFAGVEAREKERLDIEKSMREEYDAEKKQTEELKKLGLEGYFAGVDAREKAAEEKGKIMREEYEDEKKINSDRLKATRDLYKDIRGYEVQSFDATKALIQEQAAAYKKLGVDEVAVAVWVAQETDKAYIAMGRHSTDWKDGVKAGLVEITQAQTTWGTAAYEVTKTTFDGAAKAFGTNFKDVVKGDFTNIGQAWSSLWDSALQTFGEQLGKMVMEAAAKDVKLLFDAQWTADGSAVIAMLTKIGSWIGGMFGGGEGLGTDWADDWGRANGGSLPDHPVWVGERGPELLFSGGPGYVMEHNQSMAYAAMNGGYIPGRAHGGPIGPDDYRAFVGENPRIFQDIMARAQSGGELSYLEAYMLALDQGKHFRYAPEAELHKALLMSWARDPQNYWDNDVRRFVLPGNNRKRVEYWDDCISEGEADSGGHSLLAKIFMGVVDAIITYATAGTKSLLAGAFMGFVRSQAGNTTIDWGEGLMGGALGAYAGYMGGDATWQGLVKEMAKSTAKIGLASLLGGGERGLGMPQFNVSGSGSDNGLSDMFGEQLSGIAPRQIPFGFSARNGLDYVPRDNTLVLTHEGEGIITKEENRERRQARAEWGSVPFEAHFHLHGTVIDRAALDEFAEEVYPRIEKLRKLGH